MSNEWLGAARKAVAGPELLMLLAVSGKAGQSSSWFAMPLSEFPPPHRWFSRWWSTYLAGAAIFTSECGLVDHGGQGVPCAHFWHAVITCRWAAVICGAFGALTFYGAELVSGPCNCTHGMGCRGELCTCLLGALVQKATFPRGIVFWYLHGVSLFARRDGKCIELTQSLEGTAAGQPLAVKVES